MDGEMTARDLVELLPQPAWIYDCETLRILVVSDAAVNAYGYSRDEFLGFTIRDIRPPEELPSSMRRFRVAGSPVPRGITAARTARYSASRSPGPTPSLKAGPRAW
jgi:PAS domain-containing protein